MLRSPRITLTALAAAIALLGGCGQHKASATSATGGCDQSITLPPGFCALIFAESAGPARGVVVRRNGDVIVGVLDARRQVGGMLAAMLDYPYASIVDSIEVFPGKLRSAVR
jgi:hypothetical protein